MINFLRLLKDILCGRVGSVLLLAFFFYLCLLDAPLGSPLSEGSHRYLIGLRSNNGEPKAASVADGLQQALAALPAETGASAEISKRITRVFSPDSHLRNYCKLDPADQLRLHNATITASRRYGVPVELLFAVMAVESRCRNQSVSNRGAVGIMQIQPATANWLGINDPRSLGENVIGGAKYLAYLGKRFEGDLVYTLAAYNAGPAAVRRYDSIPPYRETKQYVEKVLKLYLQLRYHTGSIASTV